MKLFSVTKFCISARGDKRSELEKTNLSGRNGLCGRVIEYDGENWTTVLDHDYWILSLETYNNRLYAGTANQLFTYIGTDWETSFHTEEEAYYTISMISYDSKIYAGMGNGYIFEDPIPETMQTDTVIVPKLSSTIIMIFLTITMLLLGTLKETKKM